MPTVGHSRRSRPRRGGLALLADLLDALLHLRDPGPDDPPVGLELALAGAPRADPAAGPRQVRPQPRQARQLVFELGELDLEAALVGLGVEREDVEDQPAAVDDLDVEQLLEGALLGGRQLVVGDEDVEAGLALGRGELLGLALADVPVRVDVAAVLPLGADDVARPRSWRGWPARRASPRRSSRRRRRCRRRRGRPSRRAYSVRSCRVGHRRKCSRSSVESRAAKSARRTSPLCLLRFDCRTMRATRWRPSVRQPRGQRVPDAVGGVEPGRTTGSERNHVRWRLANATLRWASSSIAASRVSSPSRTAQASR